MKKQVQHGALVIMISFLAACATEAPPPAPEEPQPAVETAPAEPEIDAKMAEEELKRQQLLSEERVYFAYDSAAVDEPSRAVIEAHSQYIMENPDVSVSLEGHCDERGTREYNLALGERRAQSVQKLMAAYGVPANQLTVVSFGEEKPADPGHDESAWRKNRRVEIVYKIK